MSMHCSDFWVGIDAGQGFRGSAWRGVRISVVEVRLGAFRSRSGVIWPDERYARAAPSARAMHLPVVQARKGRRQSRYDGPLRGLHPGSDFRKLLAQRGYLSATASATKRRFDQQIMQGEIVCRP